MRLGDYPKLFAALHDRPPAERAAHMRNLGRTDLYFLLRYLLRRADVEHPWLFARCREVQENPNGYLDLWAREHYKSTIITYAKTIQDILSSHGEEPTQEREITVGIFSFNRPSAKKFLSLIKFELTNNALLKELYPDILWADPDREAPSWSLDGGITVKRVTNPREATVEAWGLVDSMPTGSHFLLRVYDDVITEQYARSPDMVKKATESWELSLNLGARGGNERYIGTRYAYADTYKVLMDRQAAVPRIYPATADGTLEGEPVFLTREELDDKRRKMGPYVFGSQMMQNPLVDEAQGFRREWLRFYKDHRGGAGMNVYLIVDPANDKKKKSDYTAMIVLGLASDRNLYLLDMLRDRLNLSQRTAELMRLHRKWQPLKVGYERYGKDSDIAHIKDAQEAANYRFEIEELGGMMGKNDRIRRMLPYWEQGRFWLPPSIFKTDREGKTRDVIDEFLNEEYDPFPVGVHEDVFDAISRIEDMTKIWPRPDETRERYQVGVNRRRSWLAR